MASKRETILAALHARLQTLATPVLRGDVLPERIPANGLIILRDGKPGEPEVTLSPVTYFYEHRAELASVFDVAAIGVACALGYIDLRLPDLGWRERQPKLAAWYAEVSQRESMLKTAPSVA